MKTTSSKWAKTIWFILTSSCAAFFVFQFFPFNYNYSSPSNFENTEPKTCLHLLFNAQKKTGSSSIEIWLEKIFSGSNATIIKGKDVKDSAYNSSWFPGERNVLYGGHQKTNREVLSKLRSKKGNCNFITVTSTRSPTIRFLSWYDQVYTWHLDDHISNETRQKMEYGQFESTLLSVRDGMFLDMAVTEGLSNEQKISHLSGDYDFVICPEKEREKSIQKLSEIMQSHFLPAVKLEENNVRFSERSIEDSRFSLADQIIKRRFKDETVLFNKLLRRCNK